MNPYRCVFQMGIERSLEYRVDFIMTLLSAIFPIIIQTFLWNYMYGNSNATDMTGYTYSQIMIYTLLAAIVSKLVGTGFEYQINQEVKMGGLNKYLVRPINYWGYHFCSFLGGKLPNFIILVLVSAGILTYSVIVLQLSLTFLKIMAFLISLILALILNFFLFYCVALLSFWLTDVNLMFGTVSVVLVVLSGGIFPMDIFGETVANLVNLLPFGYTTQFPINIINGKLSWNAVGIGFGCQLIWIGFFAILGFCMWKRGLKRFVAVGG